IPFIFTSAFVLGVDENKLLSLSADAFVAKPINVDKLFYVIELCTGLKYKYMAVKKDQEKPVLCPQEMKASFYQLPQQQQDVLRRHANDGNIKKIRNLAGFLKDDEVWQNLGNHICEMVMKYDMDGLINLFSEDNKSPKDNSD
ncbi:MAG: hypothetical protein QM504_02360, partial [Pseudomonadota bacterium]